MTVPSANRKRCDVNKGANGCGYKGYADSVTAHDKVIRTQDDFDALIANPDWLGATSVALVGQFTVSRASGIKIPDTVRQIHGFNQAKITITNFVYDQNTAKGGLGKNSTNNLDYSIRDLRWTVPDRGVYGFYNCTNLTNCTGTGQGEQGHQASGLVTARI